MVRRTPQVVVYAATLVMLVPPLLFGEAVGPWIHRGLAVLLIAPVNSLIFALLGPVLSARTALARLGGVVDSHDALSALGRATRLTLSHSLVMDPRFTLARVEPLVPMGEDDALQIAASFLAGEDHPWGAAFAEAAEGHGLELAPPIHRSDFDGEGLVGKLRTGDEEDEFAIGTTAWMQRLGVQLPGDLDERLDQAAREGSCLIWLAYGGRAMAVFALQSRVKDGTRRLVQRLKKAGVRSVCLLSTRESPLIERFADQAGMDGGYGELTADQAEALLAQWREAGERVALVVGPESPVESDAAEVTVRFDAETPVQTGSRSHSRGDGGCVAALSFVRLSAPLPPQQRGCSGLGARGQGGNGTGCMAGRCAVHADRRHRDGNRSSGCRVCAAPAADGVSRSQTRRRQMSMGQPQGALSLVCWGRVTEFLLRTGS